MSGPNTRFMDEREPFTPVVTPPESAPQSDLQLTPGVVLELGAIEQRLDDLVIAKRTLHLSDNLATFKKNALRFAALAQHFADEAAALRPRPPHRSLSNEE